MNWKYTKLESFGSDGFRGIIRKNFLCSDGFLLDGILWKLIPSWKWVSDWFVQPIAQPLIILVICTILFAIHTLDYKNANNANYNELWLTEINIYECCYVNFNVVSKWYLNVVNSALRILFERCEIKHITCFNFSQKFLLLGNQCKIFQDLVCSQVKITVNIIFNFISAKMLCQ